MDVPAPFVYWGQNSRCLTLKVALQDVVDQPEVKLTSKSISFQAIGTGALGEKNYQFELDLFDEIKPEGSQMRLVGRYVQLLIEKSVVSEEPWPRLSHTKLKYHWLKPDFDHMDVSEDSDDQGPTPQQMERQYIENLTKDMMKAEQDVVADLKKNYLFFYSLLQSICYVFIFVKVSLGVAFNNDYRVYEDINIVLTICLLVSWLEVLHGAFGLVKSGFISPFIQTLGRNMFYFMFVYQQPELQVSQYLTTLIWAWSAVEIIRYPFYMCSIMNVEFYYLKWLRYTVWIILYPLGGGSEWVLAYISRPLFLKSRQFSISLPNEINFGFDFSTFILLYLVIQPILLIQLMLHMWKLRTKSLKSKKH